MRRRSRRKNTCDHSLGHDDIVRLWIMRLLVPLGGHRNFIQQIGFSDDQIARAIGLGGVSEDEDEEEGEYEIFDRSHALVSLRRLHRQTERALVNVRPPRTLRDNTRRLAGLIGLDDGEQRILEFTVLLHDTPMLDEVTELLGTLTTCRLYRVLSALLDLPEQDIRAALSSDSRLTRSGLVNVDHSGTFNMTGKLELLSRQLPGRMLSRSEDPLALLREVIAPCDTPTLSLDDFAHLSRDLSIAEPYLRRAAEHRLAGVNLYIHGDPGTGKSQLARVLAKTLGRPLYEVACEDQEGNPITGRDRLRALRAAQYVLGAGESLLLFDEAEDIFDSAPFPWRGKSAAQTHKGWLNSMLESNPVPILWLSNSARGLDPAFVRRFDMVFEARIPPRRGRERIVRQLCDERLAEGAIGDEVIARIAGSEVLAPAVVERAARVVHAVRAITPDGDAPAMLERLIDNTLTTQGHGALSAARTDCLPGWYEPEFLNTGTDLLALADGLRRGSGARLCLYGPPGTGKTAFGRWLADSLDRPLLARRGSDLLDPYIGVTEQNIASMFREASEDGALLLIDEIDGFLHDRRDAVRSWEVTQVNELLTSMERFDGIFVASTNRLTSLDPAALRRFDLKIGFDYLRPKQAWRMFARQCTALGLPRPAPSLRGRLDALAVLTPGDFATVSRQHRFRPFRHARDMLDALAAECDAKEDAPRRAMGFV